VRNNDVDWLEARVSRNGRGMLAFEPQVVPAEQGPLRTSVAALWLSGPVRERMAACTWRRA